MPNVNPTCQQHTLSRGEVAHVQRCEHCGSVSIHMGPMSVRLDDRALRSLWITLGDAVETLDRERTAPRMKSFPGVSRGDA